MDIVAAKAILKSVDEKTLMLLKANHERYFYFAGTTPSPDDESRIQAENDRLKFPEFLLKTSTGAAQIASEHIAGFMVAVSGLPMELCLAWDEYDFNVTHGLLIGEDTVIAA